MKKDFAWLALTFGLVVSLLLMWFSPLNKAAAATMPLLMALFMAELGFFVTASGGVIAIRRFKSSGRSGRLIALAVGNFLISANLFYAGYNMWPRIQ